MRMIYKFGGSGFAGFRAEQFYKSISICAVIPKTKKISTGVTKIESGYVINKNELLRALSNKFGKKIIGADFGERILDNGSLGDVRLVTGNAETESGNKLPYSIVLKIQKKWERNFDPGSWRKEYDLYNTPLGSYFNKELRWPSCYEKSISEDETRIWMEYAEGVTGLDMTPEMYERAAYELGRFQGKLYERRPEFLPEFSNLSGINFMKEYYLR